MSENVENKFENIDSCYNELIDSMKKAKESANKSGQSLLDILANFVKLYYEYYKRVKGKKKKGEMQRGLALSGWLPKRETAKSTNIGKAKLRSVLIREQGSRSGKRSPRKARRKL